MALPANEQYQPRSAASPTRCGAEKQWRITGASPACGVERGEDLVGGGGLALGVAGVDHDRQAQLARRSRSAPRRRGAGPPARRCRGRSRARSRRSPAPSRGRRAPDFLRRRLVEAGRRRWGGGRPRRRRASWRSARGDRSRVGLRPHPDRQHPIRPRRRGRAATSSSSSPSQSNRWVWESIIGTVSLSSCHGPPLPLAGRGAPLRHGRAGRRNASAAVPHFPDRAGEPGVRAVVGNPEAPYLNHLAQRGALATSYFGVTHPSLPNYLALFGGSTFGIAENCTDCVAHGPNLATQLRAPASPGAPTWRGLPHPCFTGARLRPLRETPQPLRLLPLDHPSPAAATRSSRQTRLSPTRRGRLPASAG